MEPGFGEPPLWLLLNKETHISFSFKLGQSWPCLCFLFIQLPLSGVCPPCPVIYSPPEACFPALALVLGLVFLPLLCPWQAWKGLPKVVPFT